MQLKLWTCKQKKENTRWLELDLLKKKTPQRISEGSRKCVSHGKRKVTDAQCTCNRAGKSAGELLIYWFWSWI